MYNTSQKLIAEFIGTFALIFFGAGSICTDNTCTPPAASAFSLSLSLTV